MRTCKERTASSVASAALLQELDGALGRIELPEGGDGPAGCEEVVVEPLAVAAVVPVGVLHHLGVEVVAEPVVAADDGAAVPRRANVVAQVVVAGLERVQKRAVAGALVAVEQGLQGLSREAGPIAAAQGAGAPCKDIKGGESPSFN